MQEINCQDIPFKIGFLQISCHYLKIRLGLVIKSFPLVNLY